MEDLIKQAFLHIEVIGPHVAEGHYDLVGPNGDIILPQVWETVVEPDWSITMHMWPIPEKPKEPDPPPADPPAPAAAAKPPAPEAKKKEGRLAFLSSLSSFDLIVRFEDSLQGPRSHSPPCDLRTKTNQSGSQAPRNLPVSQASLRPLPSG